MNIKSVLFVASFLPFINGAQAEDLYFPTDLLGSDVADLPQLSANGAQLPGVYQVDIYLNNRLIANRPVRFESIPAGVNSEMLKDDTGLVPCLSGQELSRAGVKTDLYPELVKQGDQNCAFLGQYIPAAFTVFDFQKLRLDISVPQASVRNAANGYIDPELWDDGINAIFMNYNFSASNRSGNNADDKSYFLGLNGGINLGPWRLRDYRTWNYYNHQYSTEQKWQHIQTYAERAIIPLRSNLLLGESTTSSDIFDSLGFRGVQMSTDDNMLPEAMRGYSPVIRGIAQGNAEVTVRQNGYVIYKSTVPPGKFEITDLNPASTSGDLEVTVTEASGKSQVFTVPYSSVPMMQREGMVKYTLTAGRFKGNSSRYDNPVFSQGTLMWGLPHDVTLYGGIQYSPDYLAVQSGVGINMGALGAISADITNANSTLADESQHQGQSARLLYAQAFDTTGTQFRLAGYRYSTKGFHTLDETALKVMSGRLYDHNHYDDQGNPVVDTYSDYYNLSNTKRARYELNISQKLADFGSVWLTGMRQTYWNTHTSNTSLQAGYSNMIGPVSYFLSYGYTRQQNSNAPSYTDRTIGLTLSVPLNRLLAPFSGNNSVYANFNGRQDAKGHISQQVGLSGSMLESKNLNWYVSQGYSHDQHSSGNASLTYKGGYGNAGVGYSYGSGERQYSYSASGSALLHRNGLTLGQPMGENSVLIAAPGVSDISIQNQPGVKTDWHGYAIQPYVMAYHENRVAINSNTLDDKTDIVDGAVLSVVPTKGAIVRAEVKAHRGQRLILTLSHNGKPLPFGTVVTSDENSGLVGDAGQVYLSGMAEDGKVTARWGEGHDQQCQAIYHLNDNQAAAAIAHLNEQCH